MKPAHRPRAGSTLRLRIWRLLRRKGPLTPRAIAAYLDHGLENTRQTLQIMRRDGNVSAAGNTSLRLYRAMDQPPEDMRGTAPGSVAVFVRLAKARRKAKKPRRPVPQTALERYWR